MRLIDADALCDAMYHEAFENDASYNESNPMAKWDSGLWIRYKMFENAIADAPTIDADRPQGEWLLLEPRYSIEQKVYWNKEQALADTKGNGALERRKCSCCGYTKQFSGYMKDKTFKLWSFCPNCGARMKGADDETD